MKEQITDQDVTIEVNGFFYKIPYFVMLEDEDLCLCFKVLKDFEDAEILIKRNFLHPSLLSDSNSLFILKATVALKKNEYYSFRYVKLNEIDDAREAMMRYVEQFKDPGTLDYLKRELAFFAGAEWRQFHPFFNKMDQLFDTLKMFLGGLPETITIEVPTEKFWKCSDHVFTVMKELSLPGEGTIVRSDHPGAATASVRPISTFIFGPLTIIIKGQTT
jgi:hypothetical protein